MITHKISPHTEEPAWRSHGHRWRTPGDEWNEKYAPRAPIPLTYQPEQTPYTIMIPMGAGFIKYTIHKNTPKVVYATWLGTLKYKRGDYVVNVHSKPPYVALNYLRVLGLQEIHFLCNYDHKGRALALELLTEGGTRFFTNCNEWEVVNAPDNPAFCFDLK